MQVVYSDDCLLHNPPHEILSGKQVPYLESPARYLAIREALLQPALSDSSTPQFEFVKADSDSWPSSEVEKYILSVHTADYVEYLRNAYENWVQDGGDSAGVLPETFFHSKLAQFQGHDVTRLSPIAKAGLYCFDLSTSITAGTYQSAVSAVRVALTASHLLASARLAGSEKGTGREAIGSFGVFALTRPPGHHAGSSLCGGYCFFNNVAIAARFLQHWQFQFRFQPQPQPQELEGCRSQVPNELPRSRIAIIDVDYHHGNGTQEIFYDDPSVFYVSLHGMHDYPYFTGGSDEQGIGEGTGFNLNIQLPRKLTGDAEYLAALEGAIEEIRLYDPICLIVSLGVDTFENDPICEFGLTTDGFGSIGSAIAALMKPTLFVMEGGYDLDTLGINVRAMLEGFLIKSDHVG